LLRYSFAPLTVLLFEDLDVACRRKKQPTPVWLFSNFENSVGDFYLTWDNIYVVIYMQSDKLCHYQLIP
ncbi:MAG: hypothetical protein ABEI86_01385, partial [Halobacteriaceae archaeon]